MVRMVRTCLFLIDNALKSEYVRNILAVMPPLCLPSRCRNVSVGRLLVWPDFALLESLRVSPLARSLLPPHSLREEQVLRPRAGDQLPCQQPSGRAREAVPSRRTQLPPVNTRSSQRHQLGGRSGVATTLCAFFLPEITFLLAHLGPHCSSVTTLSRPGKGLHDGKIFFFKYLLFFQFSVLTLKPEPFYIFWGRLYNLEHLFLPSLVQSQRNASVL